MRTQDQIIHDIREFQPEAEDWRGLERLLAELWKHTPSIDWIDPILGIFDRFPDDDGSGVFWSIVHGLESIEGYEPLLVASNTARPSMMKGIMVRRLEG